MFDIGFSELLVVALVGLIVIGPKRLPEVARTAGQWVAKVRRFVADVKQDIDREMQKADLNELRNLKQELDETRRVVEQTSSSLIKEANIAPPPEPTGMSPTVPSPTQGTAPAAPAVEAPAAAPAQGKTPPKPRKARTVKRRKKSTAS
jgi:sec-independent protein translocase protein TatB